MKYLGLTAFCELGNGFFNDRQVDIAVMGISLQMCIRDRLWHALPWSGGFQ